MLVVVGVADVTASGGCGPGDEAVGVAGGGPAGGGVFELVVVSAQGPEVVGLGGSAVSEPSLVVEVGLVGGGLAGWESADPVSCSDVVGEGCGGR